MAKPSDTVIVAIIGAIASIVVALISSNIFAKASVRQSVGELKITDVDVWESKAPNVAYTAERSGVVVAVANANSTNRHVPIEGRIAGELIAAAAAQDSYVQGVPSIASSSFAMPVPKGKQWTVVTPVADRVQIKWFTTRAEIVPPK